MIRCAWARTPALVAYHDEEWGRPHRDDRALFELLVLEGAQAGLSWSTILAKRERYRARFDGFAPERVAAWDAARIEAALGDPGIVRHRGKIAAAVTNARGVLAIAAEHGSFARWLWSRVDDVPVVRRPATDADVPAVTPLAEALSRDLRRHGFAFVGPTICYAFLQAAGIVDDHVAACIRAQG